MGPSAQPVPDPTAAVGRTSRGERTRARLLAAAREALREAGWSRARVEDVCRVAGVGHGTFYAYYANKTAVLEALVRQHAAALDALVAAPWSTGAGDPGGAGAVRADVRGVIGGFVSVSLRDRDVRELWLAAAPSEPVLDRLVHEVRRQFASRVRAALAAARAAGLLRDGLDLDVAALALAAMVEQTVALVLSGASAEASPADADRLVEGLTDLWVHAVYRVEGPT